MRLIVRDIVIFEPEPPEAVAASPARHRQRHRRAGDRPVTVADQPLDGAAIAGAARITTGGANQLFVGTAQQEEDKLRTIERPAVPQPRHDAVAVGLGMCKEVRSEPEADFIGNLLDQGAEHRRHQGAFLFGQPRAIVEEQVAPHDRQPVAPRGPRGFDLIFGCLGSDGPFDRQHWITMGEGR